MQTLREKLFQTSNFLFGVELVSVRGSLNDRNAAKTLVFGNELARCPDRLTGSPSPTTPAAIRSSRRSHLGKPILGAGKEVVIHLTCKDLNRNGLESQAWFLNSEGFHNILAMTGDYPVGGNEGLATKPVFDIDSVGLDFRC